MAFLFHRHALPLRWLRLPLLVFTLGMSGVCIAVCAQAISGTMQLERHLADVAISDGLHGFRFDMQDVRATTVVLLVVACLISLTALGTAAILIRDWFSLLLVHPGDAFNLEVYHSTKTLKLQSQLFGFLSICLLAVLIPSTTFVRTRRARVFDDDNVLTIDLASTDTKYWDYGFLRCLGAAPWFTLIASLPMSFVSISAWKLRPSCGDTKAFGKTKLPQ